MLARGLMVAVLITFSSSLEPPRAALATAITAGRTSWQQPRFGIGGYFTQFIGKPGQHADFALLAEANFTVAHMGSDIAACKATGLGCISELFPTTKGADNHSSLWGYNVGDEPGLLQFEQHATKFKTIRQLRPGSMGFSNLLESYCPSSSLAANPWDGSHPPASTLNESIMFEDYVERYVQQVQPDFLCTDYYPYFEVWNQFPFANRLNAHTAGRGVQSVDNFVGNLLVIRAAALRHNLTFWTYFGAAAFQGHTMATEAQMKLQMMAAVTVGARGLLYWVIGGGDASGWAVPTDAGGRIGRHWAQARRLNTHILGLGPTLMQLDSNTVTRIHANATPGAGLGAAGAVVTLVQESVGCSLNTPADVVNQHGSLVAHNPACEGNFHYVACPGLRSAVPQPSLGSSLLPSSPHIGWCMADVLSKDSCELFCNALHQLHGPTSFLCGSYDWASTTQQCCLNPPGPGRYLRSDPGFTHFAKVADSSNWVCPNAATTTFTAASNCTVNNTKPACEDWGGPGGEVTVGHDFLLSESTHTDGRRAFTLMNFDTTISAVPTVVVSGATTNTTADPGKRQLMEVDPVTGREIVAIDDVPLIPGMQISLDVAEARVFLIGRVV